MSYFLIDDINSKKLKLKNDTLISYFRVTTIMTDICKIILFGIFIGLSFLLLKIKFIIFLIIVYVFIFIESILEIYVGFKEENILHFIGVDYYWKYIRFLSINTILRIRFIITIIEYFLFRIPLLIYYFLLISGREETNFVGKTIYVIIFWILSLIEAPISIYIIYKFGILDNIKCIIY